MTEVERKEMQDMLIPHASELRLGINMKDPSLVPHIANDSIYLNTLTDWGVTGCVITIALTNTNV